MHGTVTWIEKILFWKGVNIYFVLKFAFHHVILKEEGVVTAINSSLDRTKEKLVGDCLDALNSLNIFF